MELFNINTDIFVSPITSSDESEYCEIFKDDQVSQTLLVIPSPYTMADAKWWTRFTAEQTLEKSCHWNLAIRSRREVGKIIGGLGINSVNKDGVARIGYWLAVHYWGKGLMPQILSKWFDYMRLEQRASGDVKYSGIRTLQGAIFAHNGRSARVLLKAGFQFVKEVPNGFNKNGVLMDGMIYERPLQGVGL